MHHLFSVHMWTPQMNPSAEVINTMIHISIHTLPTEMILAIVVRARTMPHQCPGSNAGVIDQRTLAGLFISCRRINAIMQAAWPAIVGAYTDVSYHNERNYTYYFCGRLHRADGPAQVAGSARFWYCYGRRHRDNDLPAIEMYPYHQLTWYTRGVRGRISDLPATYSRHQWSWRVDDKIHREAGPAVVAIQLSTPPYANPTLLLWDGVTDMSVVGYDWRQLIDIAPELTSTVTIVYEYFSYDQRTDRQVYPLIVSPGGAYIAR